MAKEQAAPAEATAKAPAPKPAKAAPRTIDNPSVRRDGNVLIIEVPLLEGEEAPLSGSKKTFLVASMNGFKTQVMVDDPDGNKQQLSVSLNAMIKNVKYVKPAN